MNNEKYKLTNEICKSWDIFIKYLLFNSFINIVNLISNPSLKQFTIVASSQYIPAASKRIILFFML